MTNTKKTKKFLAKHLATISSGETASTYLTYYEVVDAADADAAMELLTEQRGPGFTSKVAGVMELTKKFTPADVAAMLTTSVVYPSNLPG